LIGFAEGTSPKPINDSAEKGSVAGLHDRPHAAYDLERRSASVETMPE